MSPSAWYVLLTEDRHHAPAPPEEIHQVGGVINAPRSFSSFTNDQSLFWDVDLLTSQLVAYGSASQQSLASVANLSLVAVAENSPEVSLGSASDNGTSEELLNISQSQYSGSIQSPICLLDFCTINPILFPRFFNRPFFFYSKIVAVSPYWYICMCKDCPARFKGAKHSFGRHALL